MKVVHTQGTCGGVETCVELAPDYFVIGEDGQTRVAIAEIAEGDLERVTNAVNECPTGALRLVKDEEATHA